MRNATKERAGSTSEAGVRLTFELLQNSPASPTKGSRYGQRVTSFISLMTV